MRRITQRHRVRRGSAKIRSHQASAPMSFSESSAAAMVRSMSSAVWAAEAKAGLDCGCDGKAAADDFAERGEIGFDAENLLRGAVVQAKTGDDFVDDEQRAVLFCEVAKAGKKIGRGRNNAHVRGDGFDDYRGYFVFVLREDSLDCVE